ncbi:hypothetical protein ACLMJK_008985 [Lecanora helva]
MVSTRNHPSTFPPPDVSPSKALTRSSPTFRKGWVHIPDRLTLLWLVFSLPLVIWDTAYVLLRPYSMTGGILHNPIWTPYTLYGSVDLMYGKKAWDAHNGFTAAQGILNLLESLGYIGYLLVVWRFGEGQSRTLAGGWGGVACLTGFALSVMTLSKTLLYVLNEACSGFDNIGHNEWPQMVFLWIIPNGSWIVLPAYMTYAFAKDILNGLAKASGDTSSKPARAATPTKDE